MTLFEQWKDLIENQTEETFRDFWEEYSGAETKIYSDILDKPEEKMTGTLGELAAKYEVRPVIFMGFLDGINSSLKKEIKLDSLKSGSKVTLDIDFEKLYYNMLDCKAEWLYTLKEWEPILTPERRKEITQEFRTSKMFVKTAEPGRNDPCPCGSGKKYKKCCGAGK